MADVLTIHLQKSGIYFPKPHQTAFPFDDGIICPFIKPENILHEPKSQQYVMNPSSTWTPPTPPPGKFSPPSSPEMLLQSPKTPRQKKPMTESPRSPNIIPPRGRPRADVVNLLIEEGASSCCSIRCDICNRVFPREKSLQAHKRTHSGERPYVCDFPNCGKAFVQSGQLKTHQRLHTGEKPFICSVDNCSTRFTHANRHCPMHPCASLKREYTEIPLKQVLLNENTEPNEYKLAVLQWLDKYEREREERNPAKIEEKELKRKYQKEIERENVCQRKKARVEAKRRMSEQREKWFGAIALVQLAENLRN